MRGTLFGRLMISFILIVLITAGLIGMVFSNWIKNFYMGNAEENMIRRGQEAVYITKEYLEGRIEENTFGAVINVLDHYSDARLLILDPHGNIRLFSRPARHGLRLGLAGELFPNRMRRGLQLPEPYLKELKEGNIIKSEEFLPLFDERVLMVGVPIPHEKNKGFMGAVVLVAPVKGLKGTLNEMVFTLMWIIAASILLSGFVGVYLSRSIAAPLHLMSQTAIGMAGGDFTKRVKVKQKDEIGILGDSINYMASELGKLEEMRKDYVANVSHELRSPLTSIQGFIEPLMDGTVEDQETKERYYGIIHHETLRLSRLVKDLMELSGLQSGNIRIEMEPLQIEGIIKSVFDRMKPLCENKDILLQFISKGTISDVLANEDRLVQLLTIFLDNALAYTPVGGKIEVEVRQVEDNKDEVAIIIKDTGAGIPEADIPYIWDRFYKVDKSRGITEGTGLGLSIAKQIILLHNGRFWAESQAGEGCVIGFTLPVSK